MYRFLIKIQLSILAAALLFLGQVRTLQAENFTVVYVTDFEGSEKRLSRFYRTGPFYLGFDHQYHLLPGYIFVYGGDAPDRFYGSRWVARELVRLKMETPKQIFFILGNRDVNKMILSFELSPSALAVWGTTKAERLKFLLKEKMGSPKAFELQRAELAAERDVSLSQVSDADVAQSFIDDVGPKGPKRKILEMGQLLLRIKNTSFFHSDITEFNDGYVPGHKMRFQRLDDWAAHLNPWFQAGLNYWASKWLKWDGVVKRKELLWTEYAKPPEDPHTPCLSLIAGHAGDRYHNPELPPQSLIKKNLAQGIQRWVSGHTPIGDYPLTVRTPGGSFEWIHADLSYSENEDWISPIYLSGENLEFTNFSGQIAQLPDTVFKTNLQLGIPSLIGQKVPGSAATVLGQEVNKEREGNFLSFEYGPDFQRNYQNRAATDLGINSCIDKTTL